MPLDTSIKKVLVIGSGPIVIGQAAEFDYAGAQACRILKEAGVDVVPCRILYDTPDGKMHLFCRVRVIYGEPMPAAQFAMEGRRDTKKLRANKQALLDAWEKMGR